MKRFTIAVGIAVLFWSVTVVAVADSTNVSLAYQTEGNINIIEFDGMTPGAEIELTNTQDWLEPQWLDKNRLLGIRSISPETTRDIWMVDMGGQVTQLTTNGQVGQFVTIPGTDCIVFERELSGPSMVSQLWKMQIGQPGERIKSVGDRPMIKLMAATSDNVTWVECPHIDDNPEKLTHDRIVTFSLKTGQIKILYRAGQNGKWEEIYGLCRSWEKGKLLFLHAPYESADPDTSQLYNIYLVSIDEQTGVTKRVAQFYKALGQGARITPGPVPESIVVSSPAEQAYGITLFYPKLGGIHSPFRSGYDPCFSSAYGNQ